MKFRIGRHLRSRLHLIWMIISLMIVILLPFILGIGLYIKSTLLLEDKKFGELLFSSDWRPLSGHFGFLTFAISSVWVTVLALLIAGPICLLTAIHLTQYAKNWVLKIMHPVIDILAGIPSVIFGVWGILVIVPFISKVLAPMFGVETSGYTILTGAMILLVMLLTIPSLQELFSFGFPGYMHFAIALGGALGLLLILESFKWIRQRRINA